MIFLVVAFAYSLVSAMFLNLKIEKKGLVTPAGENLGAIPEGLLIKDY